MFDESYEFYISCQQAVGALGSVLNCYGMYAILRFSPSSMSKQFKMFLIYYQAINIVMDLFISLIMTPLLLSPNITGAMYLGPKLNAPSWLYYVTAITLVGISKCSAAMLLEYRRGATQPPTRKYLNFSPKQQVALYVYLHLMTFAVAITTAFYTSTSDQKNQLEILKKMPSHCIPPEMFTREVILFSKENFEVYRNVVLFSIIFCMILGSGLCFDAYFCLRFYSSHMSKITKKIHKSFLFSVVYQLAVPLAAVDAVQLYFHLEINVTPNCITNLLHKQILLMVFSSHGAIGTCCTLVAYKSYRPSCVQCLVAKKRTTVNLAPTAALPELKDRCQTVRIEESVN